jgi:hypothetical protein
MTAVSQSGTSTHLPARYNLSPQPRLSCDLRSPSTPQRVERLCGRLAVSFSGSSLCAVAALRVADLSSRTSRTRAEIGGDVLADEPTNANAITGGRPRAHYPPAACPGCPSCAQAGSTATFVVLGSRFSSRDTCRSRARPARSRHPAGDGLIPFRPLGGLAILEVVGIAVGASLVTWGNLVRKVEAAAPPADRTQPRIEAARTALAVGIGVGGLGALFFTFRERALRGTTPRFTPPLHGIIGSL